MRRFCLGCRSRKISGLAILCLTLIVGGCERPCDNSKPSVSESADDAQCQDSEIELAGTIAQPLDREQLAKVSVPDRRWETTAPVPDSLVEPSNTFLSRLLYGFGDVSDLGFRELRSVQRLREGFRSECGEFEAVESLEYKTAFYGSYVEAVCRGEKGTKTVRLTFDESEQAEVNGCWMPPSPDLPTNPPNVYSQVDHAIGIGMHRFRRDICSLSMEVEVTEKGRGRRLKCNFDVWLRSHPFFFGPVSRQPYVQDRVGVIWRRVCVEQSYAKATRDVNRYRVDGLQPGTYRVAARVSGCSGSLVSREVHLDGTEQVTKVDIPLEWADSVEVVFRDSETGEPIEETDLSMFLGGWRWRAWSVHPCDGIEDYWSSHRCGFDRLHLKDGRYVSRKVPAGSYVLGFNPPADCGLFSEQPLPKEIVLTVEPGKANQFVVTTDTVRRYVHWNFDRYVHVDSRAFRTHYELHKSVALRTVALLAFCERQEAQQVLYHLLCGSPEEYRVIAARSLLRHDDLQTHIFTQAAYILACGASEELVAACVEILRRGDAGQTETSQRAAKLEIPDDIRRLAIDLGSKYPALRVHAAGQLGDQGERAAPVIPLLVGLLDDHRCESEPDEELMIDFQTVSDAARQALGKLECAGPH